MAKRKTQKKEKKLTLSRETIRVLGDAEMDEVVGGNTGTAGTETGCTGCWTTTEPSVTCGQYE